MGSNGTPCRALFGVQTIFAALCRFAGVFGAGLALFAFARRIVASLLTAPHLPSSAAAAAKLEARMFLPPDGPGEAGAEGGAPAWGGGEGPRTPRAVDNSLSSACERAKEAPGLAAATSLRKCRGGRREYTCLRVDLTSRDIILATGLSCSAAFFLFSSLSLLSLSCWGRAEVGFDEGLLPPT